MNIFKLQLFASSKGATGSASGSHSHEESYSEGGSSSHTEGGEHIFTQGASETHSQTNSEAHQTGGDKSASLGHQYASGEVNETTKNKFDQYSQDFTQNQKVDDAYNRLQQTIDNKPGFQSNYENKLNELYDQIMNREKFSYDFNKDQMYQMYKDKYTEQGKRAMQDTLGQAAGLTGGYNSSYGQTAAQQTYQNYLQQLNDMIPTLRDQAYNEYAREGQELLNKYGITNDAYNREYNIYRDAVSDWQSDRTFNQGMYQDERNFDYQKFINDRNYWQNEYWQEKNQAHTIDNQSASNNWSDQNAQSNTDSYTNYWEETNREYWEDTQSSFWNRGMSDSMGSSWGMTGMQLGGTGARGTQVTPQTTTPTNLLDDADNKNKDAERDASIELYNMKNEILKEGQRKESYGLSQTADQFLKNILQNGYEYNGKKYELTAEEIEEIAQRIYSKGIR